MPHPTSPIFIEPSKTPSPKATSSSAFTIVRELSARNKQLQNDVYALEEIVEERTEENVKLKLQLEGISAVVSKPLEGGAPEGRDVNAIRASKERYLQRLATFEREIRRQHGVE